MSLKCFCDRCGKERKEESKWFSMTGTMNCRKGSSLFHDVCDDCYKSFRKWWKKK